MARAQNLLRFRHHKDYLYSAHHPSEKVLRRKRYSNSWDKDYLNSALHQFGEDCFPEVHHFFVSLGMIQYRPRGQGNRCICERFPLSPRNLQKLSVETKVL